MNGDPLELRPVASRVRRRVCSWWARQKNALELSRLDGAEKARLRDDVGIDAQEAERFVRAPGSDEPLLARSCERLGLEPALIDDADPALRHALEYICATCQHRRWCARSQTRELPVSEWRAFCPNAEAIERLSSGTTAPRSGA